jgi:hypothetical protein
MARDATGEAMVSTAEYIPYSSTHSTAPPRGSGRLDRGTDATLDSTLDSTDLSFTQYRRYLAKHPRFEGLVEVLH